MKLTPMLASDTTGAVLPVLVLITVVIGSAIAFLFGCVAIVLNRKLNRHRQLRLFYSILPVTISILMLILAIWLQGVPTISEFPNYVLIPASTVPLILSGLALVLWKRPPL